MRANCFSQGRTWIQPQLSAQMCEAAVSIEPQRVGAQYHDKVVERLVCLAFGDQSCGSTKQDVAIVRRELKGPFKQCG